MYACLCVYVHMFGCLYVQASLQLHIFISLSFPESKQPGLLADIYYFAPVMPALHYVEQKFIFYLLTYLFFMHIRFQVLTAVNHDVCFLQGCDSLKSSLTNVHYCCTTLKLQAESLYRLQCVLGTWSAIMQALKVIVH